MAFILATRYASQHSELVSKPKIMEGCDRKGIQHKNTLGCMAGLTLALVCVAGVLVVIE